MVKKSKLVKLRGETGEPQVKAFPMENKRARRPVGGLLLFLSGGALLASGVILGPAKGKVPAVEESLTKLTEMGFEPSALMLGGTLLIALGLIARHIRLHIQTLLQRDQSERALTEMGADLAEFCNRLVEFQADHLHFRSELENIGKRVHAHHSSDRSGEAADGLFRLAASLDQLGARLDAKLNEAVGSMHGGIHEMANLVAASRDYLQESVEDNAEGIRQIQESTSAMQSDLQEVQVKTNATMQVVSKRASEPVAQLAPAPVAPAPAAAPVHEPEAPEPEVLELEESMLDESVSRGLGLLDEFDSNGETDRPEVEEQPLALFDGMEDSLNDMAPLVSNQPQPLGMTEPQPSAAPISEPEAPRMAKLEQPAEPALELAPEPALEPISEAETFGAPEGTNFPAPASEPEPAEDEAPSQPFAADYAAPFGMDAELETTTEDAGSKGPQTVPLDAPMELSKEEPAAPAFGAMPNLDAAAPEAPLPASDTPQVPPALTGGAFSLAQPKKSGPMEIDLNAPSNGDEDKSGPADLGAPPIGF